MHMFQRTSSEFSFDFRFSRKKSQSQQNLLIKITYVAIQVCSKHLTHFMTNFSGNMFLFGVGKSICTAPFTETQELHS